MKMLSAAVVLLLSIAFSSMAQTFSSGSTGADGALNESTLSCFVRPEDSKDVCEVVLPSSGVLNYTSVHIPAGKTLIFRRNLRNTPVVLLAQGDVVVEGSISVNAWPYLPDSRSDIAEAGPGGFPGAGPAIGPGLGPGGGPGSASWVGPLSLVPLVGGSGGATTSDGYGGTRQGSGGGGAIVIASSGQISVTAGATITATPYRLSCGPYGSGGAIRLVANRITMAGNTDARGDYQCQYSGGPTPGAGIVRFEAPAGSMSFSGSSSPAPILSTINPTIVATVAPDLRIVSVGGFLVPDSAGTRKDAADLVLPKQLSDPINVLVEASNIPVGSPVTVSFGTANQGTAPTVPLAGTLASSTATIGVSGLNRDKLAYLYVQVLFAPASGSGAAGSASGEVAQVRITSAPGGTPQFAFLRRDGSVVPAHRLPPELRAWISRPSSR